MASARNAVPAICFALLFLGAAVLLAPSSTSMPTAGIVLHLPFDLDGLDASGNGNHATFIPSGAYVNTDCTNGLDAFASDATVTEPTNLQPDDFTISVWARAAGTSWTPGPWFVHSGDATSGFSLGPDGDGITVEASVWAGSWITAPLVSTIVIDEWHHYAMTWDNVEGTLELWVDGIFESSYTGAGPITHGTTTDLHIGHAGPLGWSGDGSLDEVRMYNRVLSPTEIDTLATECLPPAEGYGYGYGSSSSSTTAPSGGGGGGSNPATTSATTSTPTTAAETTAPISPTSATQTSQDASQESAESSPTVVAGPTQRLSALLGGGGGELRLSSSATLQVDGELRGPVTIEYQGSEPPEDLRFVLVDAQGNKAVIGAGMNPVQWDSSDYPNGMYTIQLERRGSNGEFATLQESGLVAFKPIIIRNPVSSLAEAAAAAAAGTAVAGVAAMLASRASVLAELAKEGAIAYGEDQLKEATDRRRSTGRRILDKFVDFTNWVGAGLAKIRGIVAIAATIILLTIFFGIEGMEQDSWADFADSILVVGVAAVIFGLGALGLESALARASFARASIRMYGPGIISLMISAVVFRSAFGYPSYTDEVDESGRSDELPDVVEAVRAMLLLASILIAFPVFIILGLWNYDLLQEGIVVAVAGLAGASMPIKPLPGHDIWKWNKPVSAGIFVLAVATFLAIHLSWLPLLWIFSIGGGALTLYVVGLFWLRQAVGNGATS